MNLPTFPDLANSAKLLKISVELEAVPEDTIFGVAIKNGLKEKKLKQVIKMIREQSNDNYLMLRNIVGKSLMEDIETVDISGQ